MNAIRDAIVAALEADRPMTVRQVFYRLTSKGAIAKTEAEYKTVTRLLAEMRRSGEIPYRWLADATRWMRRPTTFSSAEAALQRTAEIYRRSLWDDAPEAVEVWLEKDALAGVLVEVTDLWDVPLMVTRGYGSLSFLYSAAEEIRQRHENGQRTQIYYFGDRDPSGVDIDRAVQQGIGEALDSLASTDLLSLMDPFGFADTDPAEAARASFGDCATFTRVAVTPEQISAWNLPTRPTKKSDARSRNFQGESVELDALPPQRLRALATEVIERHVDQRQLEVLRVAEREERQLLERLATKEPTAGAALGGTSTNKGAGVPPNATQRKGGAID